MTRRALHPARLLRATGLALLVLTGCNLPAVTFPASAQTAAPATLMVDVPLAGLQDWIAVRNALASLGDGVGARVEALSTQGAIVSFVWPGDAGTLDAALARVGYRLDRAATPTGRPVLRTTR
ncbi:MAG: hypothetical protein MUF14_10705 [Hyphomonadaceae bacterium]|jgi:hypothetical protein|nr:hypothetical protein [Hyphomonadaceae bacterium]